MKSIEKNRSGDFPVNIHIKRETAIQGVSPDG